MFSYLVLVLFSCMFTACINNEENLEDSPYELEIPVGFPAFSIEAEKPITELRVELGRLLFFDPILSRDSSISCASCHKPELFFTDGLAISEGIEQRIGFRNTPSIANLAYAPYIFSDGGTNNLELQVLAPIEDHAEMDFNIVDVAERLKSIEKYRELSFATFEKEPDPFVITRAIAAFERTLLSGNSPYDKFTFQGNEAALSLSQQRGMNLFFGDKAKCGTCHSGHLFTNYAFENIGLYLNYEDIGRARITFLFSDEGKFKVPSLRNVAATAPYMHDGSLTSLMDVINHYDAGGVGNPFQNTLVNPIGLSDEEKNDLINFLEALTDSTWIEPFL